MTCTLPDHLHPVAWSAIRAYIEGASHFPQWDGALLKYYLMLVNSSYEPLADCIIHLFSTPV